MLFRSVLCGEMCYKAVQLMQRGIHPLTVIEGYKIASEFAIRELNQLLCTGDATKGVNRAIHNAAKTSLSTKLVSRAREYLSSL